MSLRGIRSLFGAVRLLTKKALHESSEENGDDGRQYHETGDKVERVVVARSLLKATTCADEHPDHEWPKATGVNTDVDGKYSLSVNPGNYTLIFSFLGCIGTGYLYSYLYSSNSFFKSLCSLSFVIRPSIGVNDTSSI